jgi:hypothetical protein
VALYLNIRPVRVSIGERIRRWAYILHILRPRRRQIRWRGGAAQLVLMAVFIFLVTERARPLGPRGRWSMAGDFLECLAPELAHRVAIDAVIEHATRLKVRRVSIKAVHSLSYPTGARFHGVF